MRTYHVVIGSKAFFDAALPEQDSTLDARSFLDLVRLADAAKQRGIFFSDVADILILKNDNYHGINESAHDRLGGLIEDLTSEDAEIYVHNPPQVFIYKALIQKMQKLLNHLEYCQFSNSRRDVRRVIYIYIAQVQSGRNGLFPL